MKLKAGLLMRSVKQTSIQTNQDKQREDTNYQH